MSAPAHSCPPCHTLACPGRPSTRRHCAPAILASLAATLIACRSLVRAPGFPDSLGVLAGGMAEVGSVASTCTDYSTQPFPRFVLPTCFLDAITVACSTSTIPALPVLTPVASMYHKCAYL